MRVRVRVRVWMGVVVRRVVRAVVGIRGKSGCPHREPEVVLEEMAHEHVHQIERVPRGRAWDRLGAGVDLAITPQTCQRVHTGLLGLEAVLAVRGWRREVRRAQRCCGGRKPEML